jgi:hypothetical protein
MKKAFVLVMVLALALGVFSVASADAPAPGGPFKTAFRVQNLENTNATCSYQFFDAAGNAAYTSASTSVAPGDSLYVYTPDISGLAEGSFSGVVSCDRQVGAVVNFSDTNSGASHGGVSEPAATWYAPGIYDNFYNYYSNIYVQNASSSPVDITVEIYAPGSNTPVKTQTKNAVPANASVVFEQEGLNELAKDQFYSAVIRGTDNIAPIVNIYGKGSVNDQLYSYNPFKDGSDVAYAPVIMSNYYGYNTALVVQNIGNAAAHVTVEYTNGVTSDYTIQPGAAESIYTPSVLPSGNTLYGATVTSDGQPIVVLVNESNAFNRAASYSGFTSGSNSVVAPIVEKNYYRYNSSVTCQNLGNAAATMTIEYASGQTTTSPSIAPGATHLFYQPDDPALATVPLNYISSATITSGQPIVCIINQDMNQAPEAYQVMDQLYSYNSIPSGNPAD